MRSLRAPIIIGLILLAALVSYAGDDGVVVRLGDQSTTTVVTTADQSTTPYQDGGANTRLFSQAIGPCGIPFYRDASGNPQPLAAASGAGKWVGAIQTLNTGTALVAGVAVTGFGSGATHTAVTFSVGGAFHTTLATGGTRLTSGASNTNAGIRWSVSPFIRGLNDGGFTSGGFVTTQRIGIGSADADQRAFFGLYGTAADPTSNVEPSTLLSTLYMGCDSGDANMSICSNDTSGSATCTTLGANFPCKAYGYYDLWFCAPRGGTTVGYYVRRIDSTTYPEASGTISSDLPLGGVILYPTMYINTGPTGASAATMLDAHTWGLNLQ